MVQMSQSHKNGLRIFFSATIAFLCLATVMRQVKFNELRSALEIFDWGYFSLGLASLAFGYGLRIFRWNFILKGMKSKVTFRQCATPFLGSVALNNMLPLRIGDGVRALIYPKKMNIRTSAGLSSLVLERVLDLIVLLIFFSLGVLNIGVVDVPRYVFISSYFLLLICAALIITLVLLQQKRSRTLLLRINQSGNQFATRISTLLLDALEDLKNVMNFRSVSPIALMSIFIWFGESGVFFFVLQGFGLSATIPIAILVTSIVSISTMVPSLPGYIGPFDLAAFLAITILGGSAAQSASFALIAHLALWLPTTIVGLFAIGSDYEFFMSAKEELSENKMVTKK